MPAQVQATVHDQPSQLAMQRMPVAHRLLRGQCRIDVEFPEEIRLIVGKGKHVRSAIQPSPLEVQRSLILRLVEDDLDRSCHTFRLEDPEGDLPQIGQIRDPIASVAMKANRYPTARRFRGIHACG